MKSVARRGHKKIGKNQPSIVNRRASFDYVLGDKLVVGLSLSGIETKAARLNHVSLKGAYVVPKLNQKTNRQELFLINASFTLNNNAPRGSGQERTTVNTEPRKILASRKQIDKICEERRSGLTVVPLRLLTSGRYIKLEIALGKGKKQYDKRLAIKKRDSGRELAKITKSYR